ncbi:hypothetical protein K505DRAFT_314859 [Melanomma pulvis-pyrius CBS 109.77]|uniref:DUF7580 domain-containing protein n=1 Tax=Melanomma pulvis-pyrius CBS 109.77 TaxID=1314802 RepID=A0A6A6WW59_9PLEO|nr:hypothetical protein K505DRAFT_314859 [Melanomma pulvis-pyrius CBS 109.77]
MAEVAGLILGGFPLIISALESYRECFAPLQEWWEFEREFSNFIEDLGTQQIRFENNLEKLLAPFVTSDAQMNELLNEGSPESWQDVRLQTEIRGRLGKSYEWYCAVCRKMEATLDDLERRLGMREGQVDYIADTQWQHQLRRLRISFSRKKFKHVKLLEKYNNDLREMLSSGDELASMRKRRRIGPTVVLLRSLQQHLQNLYSGLLSRRKCNDPTQHDTKILLKTLNMQDDHGNVRLHVFLDACSVRKPIEVRIADNFPTSKPSNLPRSSHRLSDLNHQVHGRAAASFSNSLTARFRKKMHDMRVSGISTMKSSKGKESTQNGIPALMPTKIARFVVPTVTESDKISGQESLTHVEEIKNICSEMLVWDSMTGCLGFIPSLKARLLFYPDYSCAAIRDQCTVVTLEDILPSSETSPPGQIEMLQKQRFVLANILASSVLQLQSTYWMSSGLQKRDIKFFVPSSSHEPVFSHPYISGPNGSTTIGADIPAMSTAECKKTLFALGVLLLELTFNQQIESLRMRKKFMGPDGAPNEYTDFCTAKKWQERVSDTYGEGLSEAIRCCIDFSFGVKEQNWNNEEFVETYVANVLNPLREVLRPFKI